MTKSELGERLEKARKDAGLTQPQVCVAMGWGNNNSRLSNYEKGRREPSIEDLTRLLEIYGLTLKEFFGEVEQKPSELPADMTLSVARDILQAIMKADPEGRKIILDKLKI